jgi:hypothetical protein
MTVMRKLIYLILILVAIGIGVIFVITAKKGVTLALEAPFINPPRSLDKNMLVGIWSVKYSTTRIDTLFVNENGTFQQVYFEQGVVYKSDWSNWYLEKINDERIYLHLKGAKNYFYGFTKTIQESTPCQNKDNKCGEIKIQVPVRAYDWIGKNWVDSDNQLILNIRQDSSQNIILLHLWETSDRGFPIIGGEAEIFRKQ